MYQELVDADIRHLNDERQAERGSDAGEWHPSGLTDCARKAVYAYKGYEPSDEKDFRSIRIMSRGTDIHEYIQDLLLADAANTDGMEFLPEVKVDTHGIKGSCDGLLRYDEGEPWEVQEFKSISPNGKRFLKGQPKPEHVKQARIYQRGLKEMGYNVKDTICIAYFDRDDFSVAEFRVDAWLDAEWYEFLGEVAELEDHVMEGTLPDRMPIVKGKKYWLCGYCEYATRCWEGE